MSTPFYTPIPAPVKNHKWGERTVTLKSIIGWLVKPVKQTIAPRRPAAPTAETIEALRAVCGDVGCDWLSRDSHGQIAKIDLSRVCGGGK